MDINLKDFRQAHGLFQSEMASILGLNQSNVSRAELRGYFTPTYPQLQTLYSKFGKEDVDSFKIEEAKHPESEAEVEADEEISQDSDITALAIIKQQSEAITRLAEKQASQTDRLIVLLEKLSEKL